jgi:hypothetical protein
MRTRSETDLHRATTKTACLSNGDYIYGRIQARGKHTEITVGVVYALWVALGLFPVVRFGEKSLSRQ